MTVELPAIAQAYLQYVRVERRLAARTVALYTHDLLRLQTFALQDRVDWLVAQTTHMRRWVARLHSSGHSPRGVALILSGWRGFYKWLGQQGHLQHNPLDGIRAPKAPKPLPKALPVDAAVQLASFRHVQGDPWLDARDAAITELLYGAGLRVGELVGLDVRPGTGGWVDLPSGQAHVLGKGSKRRTVPIGRQAVLALQQWLAVRGQPEAAALFVGLRGTRLNAQSVWQRLRKRSLLAGLSVPVHPHMLRHSMASHVLQSSSDLRAVQELLGHAHIGTTQVYTRLDYQHLSKAYDLAHPRARRPRSG